MNYLLRSYNVFARGGCHMNSRLIVYILDKVKGIGILAICIGFLFSLLLGINVGAAGSWTKTDGRWWYDNGDGTYAKGEYIDGYWLDSDGWYNSAWNGSWKHNSKGWWFQSGSWYPTSSWLKVDGAWYYFEASGYMAASKWIELGGDWYYMTESGAMAVFNTS